MVEIESTLNGYGTGLTVVPDSHKSAFLALEGLTV